MAGVWDEKPPLGGNDPGMPGASVGGGPGMNPQTMALLATLFGKPSAAPSVSGGGDPSIQMPSRVVTGPPAVQAPPPGSPSSSGAAAGMPPAPQGAAPQQAVPSMGGPMEFSTGAGRSGAITSSAIGSVFGAIHQITDKKNQDEIQHAKFLYDMVTTAQAAGDNQTVNAVLGNPKLAKKIEKYLTGELPRVPGGPAQSQGKGAPQQQKQPQVNQPGGIALPQASTQSQNAAMVQNVINERLKRNDPATIEAMLGSGASLPPELFAKVMREKFGQELSPVQYAAMSQEARLALEANKTDVLKTLINKQEDLKRATTVEQMRVEGAHQDVKAEVAGRYGTAAMIRRSIEDVASKYRAMQKELKTTAPDKMDQVIFQKTSELYKSEQATMTKAADDMEKQGHSDIAKTYRDQAAAAQKKGEDLGLQYEYTKEAKKLLEGIEMPNPDGTE